MTRWLVAGALTAIAVAGSVRGGGAQLNLALEDRADPNPRQVALGMQMFGACLSLAVSWTQHRAATIR